MGVWQERKGGGLDLTARKEIKNEWLFARERSSLITFFLLDRRVIENKQDRSAAIGSKLPI